MIDLPGMVDRIRGMIEAELQGRALEASNALRNAALRVLRGQRHGRRYRIPFTRRYYTASAPGEPPAARTGAFRLSWFVAPRNFNPGIETTQPQLAKWLQEGTRKMAPRPYREPILRMAWPRVQRIYTRRYLRGGG